MTETILAGVLESVTTKALSGVRPTPEEMLAVLRSADEDLLDVVAAASRVRRRYFGTRVKLNFLVNMKSGMCPEDCTYCSQRLGSKSQIMKYSWLSAEEAADNAERAVAAGAKRVCLVASGRGPADRDIDRVAETVGAIKGAAPEVEVCVCLGLLKPGQAERLRESGADAYNHNLNTSEENYRDICSTHTFDDRVQTVSQAKHAGLSPCSGAIFGMGETDEDVVDVAMALKDLDPDSVPVNFLIPFEGTPMHGRWELTPQRCLRVLAAFRFMFPDVEVRLAGGREIHLRTMQPLALHLANSIFLGDYLTSEGQPGEEDLKMIADAGFTVEGAEERTLPTARHDLVAVRRRGAGTTLPANT
ncbi:biotin synthase BioB [Saccharothrix sp. BKS2]|uniref:biotin synthase BioB n=1 Tax=Saccharothrix sp. BKS2 TaxID=3064400 RepID=UPI0039ED4CFC